MWHPVLRVYGRSVVARLFRGPRPRRQGSNRAGPDGRGKKPWPVGEPDLGADHRGPGQPDHLLGSGPGGTGGEQNRVGSARRQEGKTTRVRRREVAWT